MPEIRGEHPQLRITYTGPWAALQFRQAERRGDDGSLCDEQVQRLGQTFIALSERMAELRESSAWTRRTFNLNLGPLGKLL